jgi:hypothetical protein
MDRIIGVAVGLVTMYLMLSILASHLQELLAANNQSRSKLLNAAITTMLSSQALTQAFFAHPLVKALLPAPKKGPGRGLAPAYIPAEVFRKVLLTVLGQTYSSKGGTLKDVLAQMPDSALRQSLSTITMDVTDEPGIAKAIEDWYLSAMDRTIGLYKRETQRSLLLVGVVLAVTFNANTFHTAQVLWSSSSARDQAQLVAQQCIQGNNQTCGKDSTVDVKNLEDSIGKLPVGWTADSKAALVANWCGWLKAGQDKGASKPSSLPQVCQSQQQQTQAANSQAPPAKQAQTQAANPQSPPAQQAQAQSTNTTQEKSTHAGELGKDALTLLTMLAGWLFTAVAVSWGAPFWFDLLNQIVNLRIAGPKPDSSGSGPAKAAAK